ncbi:MAG: substrate-binding domain-containing protein [Bacteroidetes bacterium]|nr:substrate-binding domain-containing protein [Bacteroidota bacterium]
MKHVKIILTSVTYLLICACDYGTQKKYDDTPTSGTINISVDATFANIMRVELDTFHALYKHARVNARYCTESEAFKDLINDTARVIVASRKLNDQELQYFKQRNLTPREVHIAIDAIAFIVHPDNEDSVLGNSQIKKMLSGEITDWKQVSEKNTSGQVVMVFDNVNSSTALYARDSINKGAPIKGNVFARNTFEDVINYVSENKNAIGVVGVSYISDPDDPTQLSFITKTRVIAIKNEKDATRYKPYQAYVAQGLYPYTRNVYMISREARSGLGTGVSGFVSSYNGQLIIKKMGIMPATQFARVGGFRNNN